MRSLLIPATYIRSFQFSGCFWVSPYSPSLAHHVGKEKCIRELKGRQSTSNLFFGIRGRRRFDHRSRERISKGTAKSVLGHYPPVRNFFGQADRRTQTIG